MSKYESLFTQRVVELIENKRRDRRMTIDELCKSSGIGRNSYYAKIRGERCFNTEEIDAIARTLQCDPYLLLEEASTPQNTDAIAVAEMVRQASNPEAYGLAANRDENKESEALGDAGPDWSELA